MSDATERQLPRDLNAEAVTLAAMMFDNECIPFVVDTLTDKSFYRKQHALIYAAITQLYDEGTDADVITVIDRLSRNGDIEAAGGASYINELTNLVISSANVEHHAKIVASHHKLREVIFLCDSVINKAYSQQGTAESVLSTAVDGLESIGAAQKSPNIVDAQGCAVASLSHIEAKMRGETATLTTGYADIDRVTGGFRPGQLIIIAGRPGMGKTLFAQNMMLRMARVGAKVGFFSLEMGHNEIMERMYSCMTGVLFERIVGGVSQCYLNDGDRQLIGKAADDYSDLDITISTEHHLTYERLRAQIQLIKREMGGISVVVIDYLQLMTLGRGDKKNNQVEDMTRKVKCLAGDVGIPIVMLCQLNRGVEARNNKRPVLSDLRDSGAIEQDADMVLFPYRDYYYIENEERLKLTPDEDERLQHSLEINIEKNRNGRTGGIELYCDLSRMLIDNRRN